MDTIYFEISGFCNAHCKYCCNGNGGMDMEPKQFIPLNLFNDVLQRLRELNILTSTTTVYLYNWGEPFLHPQFNEIINILNEHKIYYGLSTNGSVYKEIVNSPFLKELKFSLPGFSQESYNEIHKLNFDQVINNVDRYINKIPRSKINITYFLYKFNTNEVKQAAQHFGSININLPYYNDYVLAVEFMKRNIIPNDMFIDHIKDIPQCSGVCPLITTNITIDEFGNVLQCCGVSKGVDGYSIGNILDLNTDQIINNRMNNGVCKECTELNVPMYWIKNGEYLTPYLTF